MDKFQWFQLILSLIQTILTLLMYPTKVQKAV